MHIDLAVDVIDYTSADSYKIKYSRIPEIRNSLVQCPYFTTNLVEFENEISFKYDKLDSFVVYMCIDGDFELIADGSEPLKVTKGETVLVPAEYENVTLVPNKNSTVLETYIPYVYVEEDEKFFENN